MGCVNSRTDNEEDLNTFHVWNVDGDGRPLRPGRIEVTDSQLIFHQGSSGGGIVVRWPLTSLRRYGFDAELFSFECGRRCATGAGVYAFRCRRATRLFATLQEALNPSTGATTAEEERPYPAQSNGSVLPTCPANLAVDSAGYLEPITHVQPTSAVRRNSGATSPGSYVCIHGIHPTEWPNGSVSSCCSLSTNNNSNHHYVNNDVTSSCPNSLCLVHQYVNSSVMASESMYVNSDAMVTLSPTHPVVNQSVSPVVDANTNYAKLDELMKQEQENAKRKEQHFYVNVKPENSRTSPTLANKVSHRYAHLTSPSNSTEENETEDIQVNYAVLDLEQTNANKTAIVEANVVATSGDGSVASSPSKSPEGYAQIDFDKTVALSSVNSAALNDESIRKTRHNAVIPCGSMSA